MSRSWIAVASANHVRIGRAAGFMQVCHGKAAPLKRSAPGDRVIYYSPTETFGGKDRLQAFTAIGVIEETAAYQVEAHLGFRPWRRDVAWWRAMETPIRPLLGRLSFTSDRTGWGYRLRFGLFEIDNEDAELIAEAMFAEPLVHAARTQTTVPMQGSLAF
ncbi:MULTISPECIES: EVE domain-containing protein [Rhizobium]|uniref:EVE domain-containing protein n=1 Tax=Rhizobium TaxID=379 RepID=UPI0007EAE8C1|nr:MULTISPECIES: EVE domain-containing protein [Rhizobium]ANK84513.1 EVE/PUA-like domain-containing protein [Rhizobium sp. N731]ANK90374.1 EVE/PUA-like domain-containing protein [Rhizobium sp. N6212]ANK96402.1 EVE/PUA-like domain-containing protein [Rhizobium sp. N621]ANL02446.1 EVE/PUA-like domain-containing protein [Rhizobium esperanzae]ANL08574.1 EVE/PUA-like domain-containing protein [Rhizobium sp. N1341]